MLSFLFEIENTIKISILHKTAAPKRINPFFILSDDCLPLNLSIVLFTLNTV
jgi:hypothetical protein